MKSSLWLLFVLFAFMTGGCPCPGGVMAATEPALRFTILHTNDLHAHDQPFAERGRYVGGMARIGHVIRDLKKRTADPVVIDAGDVFQGTPFYTLKHGQVEVELLNKIGFDIATLGNHEFDDGPKNLAEQLGRARYSIICANLDFSGEPGLDKLMKPSVVRLINGQKVGFIGAIYPDVCRGSVTLGGVKVKETGDRWMRPIADEILRLKKQGINKFVLVSHCGIELDKAMAEAMPDLDVIVGGHSHTRLDPAVFIHHDDGSSTIIVQTGCYGRAVGELRVAFDKLGRLVPSETNERLIEIAEDDEEDSDLKAYVEKEAEPLRAAEKKIIAEADTAFDTNLRECPWDSPLGDLICDALFFEARKYGATISLQNRGGICSSIQPGPISASSLGDILSFDNTLVIATIGGDTLLRTLEHGLTGYLGARFIEVHGLRYGYDRERSAGSSIVFALAEDGKGGWEPVDPSRDYRVAINSYNFKGGEGHDFSRARDVEFCERRLVDTFEDYLGRCKHVSAQAPARIVKLTQGLIDQFSSGNGKQTIKVTAVPHAKVMIVAGDGIGVEPIGSTDTPSGAAHPLAVNDARSVVPVPPGDGGSHLGIPVPLSRSRILLCSSCDETGGYQVNLEELIALDEKLKHQGTSSQGDDKRSGDKESGDKRRPLWLAAVVNWERGGEQKEESVQYPLISYPIKLRDNE